MGNNGKKLVAALLVIVLAAVLFAVPSMASNSDFEIDSDGVLVKYNGTDSEVNIPDGVSVIGFEAFGYNDYVTSITIPNSVTYIDVYAFIGCFALENITIPSSVTYIAGGAFSNCSSLTNIAIPNGVSSIEEGTFEWCSELVSVTIPSSVTNISESAFTGCVSLKFDVQEGSYLHSYCEENGIRYKIIGDGDFSINENGVLVSYNGDGGNVVIPNNVTKIGNQAFARCFDLTGITIPNSVTSIGDSAFDNCQNLQNLTIPSSVTSIGDWAFAGCFDLTSITIPGNITNISCGAFDNCFSLTDVIIENGVQSIGDMAFAACYDLTNISIPDSVTDIGSDAFWQTPVTIKVYEGSYLHTYCEENGVRYQFIGDGDFTINGNGVLVGYNGNGGYVEVPGNVTAIGNYAFAQCSSLTGISIPSSVTSIGNWAFSNCTNLTNISIPSSVTVIGENAFAYSGLTSVSIPGSVVSIGVSAFDSCFNLSDVIISEGVSSIDFGAFSRCDSLISMSIPSSVTSIGSQAFDYCYNLTSIYIPSSVTSIGDNIILHSNNAVVEVEQGSYAHNYCEENDIPFILNGVPEVMSAKFDSSATVGKAVGITVTTSTNTGCLVMCSSDCSTIYKTWTSGYTDSGDVRTWKVQYTFAGSGNRTMYFMAADSDGSCFYSLVSANVTVNKAAETAKVKTAKFDFSATVGKPVGITVTTDTSAKYIAMCSSNGAAYKTWTSGYTDSGTTRTWKVNYTFSGSGNRTMYFKASADNTTWSSLVSAAVTVNKAAKVNSAAFDSDAMVGKPVGITVTTDTTAKYIAMCSSNGAAYKTWSSGYTDSGTTRTWKVSYTFSGSGNRTMYFKASADNSAWGSLVSASVTVNKAPKVNSAAFDSDATVGKAVGITVTTDTTAKYIAMCSSNGAAYKTWTSGYTDNGSTRTWKVNYTFSGSGNRTMYFKASADSSTWSSLVSAAVTVNKAVEAAKINTVKFNSSATVGKAVGITVTTNTAAKYIAMCSSNGAAYKTWTSGYTDNGSTRTWNVSYTFSGSGSRTMYFKASADSSVWSSLFPASVTVNKQTAAPAVTSAAFNSSAIVGQSVGITVKTNTSAKYVRMYSEGGAAVKTWSSGYTDSGDVRTWNLSYSFGGAGNRKLTFKASADNSSYSSGVTASVAVNTAVPNVSYASFDASSVSVGTYVGITVQTGSNATKLVMCSEGGAAVKSWSASGNSTVSGNVRTWNVTYAFGGAGSRRIGFKATADGSTYGNTAWASVTVTK